MSDDRAPRDPILRAMREPQPRKHGEVRPFVHLRVHSAFSLLEGALPIKKIVGKAVKDGQPAIADRRHQQSVRRARILAKGGRRTASSR